MDKKQLKQITYLKKEIETIKKQIDMLDNIAFTIEGIETNRIRRLQKKFQRKIDDLIDKVEEVNLYIYNIEDSLTRQVISLRYINNLTWEQVAESIGGNNTSDGVRKVAERFLNKKEE